MSDNLFYTQSDNFEGEIVLIFKKYTETELRFLKQEFRLIFKAASGMSIQGGVGVWEHQRCSQLLLSLVLSWPCFYLHTCSHPPICSVLTAKIGGLARY